jgi:hypothetical protein
MPTPTYKPLATVTLSSSASSVTFGSIPGSYRDLVLVASADNSINQLNLRFNGDGGANYSRIGGYAPNPAVAFAETNVTEARSGLSSSGFRASVTQIMDYSATDKHKIILNRAATSVVVMQAVRWANTAAITTMLCSAGAGTFSAGSTFSLYGIAG